MALPNIFTKEVATQLVNRIQQLNPATKPLWGKMNAAQMLAHCNVTYELTYENIHPRPNGFMRFVLRNFIKKVVVSEKPYLHNSRTAPVFLVSDQQDFALQKKRLLDYIDKTVANGAAYFEGKENISFGKLTATEWNNLFYKHLHHHLTQFGV